jgi:hypothetical protein
MQYWRRKRLVLPFLDVQFFRRYSAQHNVVILPLPCDFEVRGLPE